MPPSDKPTRREFLVTTSSAALAATVPLAGKGIAATPELKDPASGSTLFSADDLLQSGPQRTFSGDSLTQIAMPLGGIGAGCICFNGYGGLQDFSIGNKPATTAMPDGHGFTDAAFALLHIRGQSPTTRLVEGPLAAE